MERIPDIPAYYDTLSATAEGLGIPLSLVKNAKASGCDAFRNSRVEVRKLIVWLATKDHELPEVDLETASAYVALERAELLRMEKLEKRKAIMSYDGAMTIINSWFLPIRQALLALPAEMSSRVNPTDPDLARSELGEWMKSKMRLIQEEIKVPHEPEQPTE